MADVDADVEADLLVRWLLRAVVGGCVGAGERVTVADPNGSEMLAVGFSPTRDRIAATMEDNSVRVYVAATGQRVGVMRGHLKKVR